MLKKRMGKKGEGGKVFWYFFFFSFIRLEGKNNLRAMERRVGELRGVKKS